MNSLITYQHTIISQSTPKNVYVDIDDSWKALNSELNDGRLQYNGILDTTWRFLSRPIVIRRD